MKNIKDGLKKTRIANLRFSKWFEKQHNMAIGAFLNLDISFQKGVFEEFFTTYNFGIFVRSTGYDIFSLNKRHVTDDDKSFANFCQFVFDDKIISNDGDYCWERSWDKNPPSSYTSEAEKYKYFTIQTKSFSSPCN